MKKFKKFGLSILITSWVIAILFVTSTMHAGHLVSFKNSVVSNLEEIGILEKSKKWGMVHVLGKGCSCSEFVADHLIKRGPKKDADEKILIVGDFDYSKKLKEAGFNVGEYKNTKGFIKGVPMLVVHDADNTVQYSGGYAPHVITPVTPIEDLKIYKDLQHGSKDVIAYGIMGCAVSKKLQKLLDPLNLKYTGVSNGK